MGDQEGGCPCCLFFVCGGSVLFIILASCVVCFVFVFGGIGRVGVRFACHFSFLCCVFCFCLWEIRRVVVRVACFLFVGGPCCLSF